MDYLDHVTLLCAKASIFRQLCRQWEWSHINDKEYRWKIEKYTENETKMNIKGT